jgi:hypothetical protein
MGRFPGSSHSNISHRNDRNIKARGFKKAVVIEGVPDPDHQAIEPGKWSQNNSPVKMTGIIHDC